MEDLLIHVVTISNNFPHIEKAAQEAADFLNLQQGLLRDPPHELREKCLFVLQLCLETKKSKFTAIAIAGLQKMIKDDRFHSSDEPLDDSKWLIFQLLRTTNCFFSLSDDVQIDLLKIFLNIACSIKWSMNGRTIISTLNLCCEAYETNNGAVQSAAQAAGNQTLCAFCYVLDEEQLDNDIERTKFNEIIPIMQFICSKIEEAKFLNDENVMVFYLNCLFTLCSSLPSHVSSNTHLKTFLWQKLCPLLISILGTPKIDKNIVTRNSAIEKEHGRGSGGLGTAPSHNSSHVKTVYCINTELIRIFGTVSTLRPVLESVFHRVLLYPAPEHRLNALKSVEELLQNANRLIDLSGPLFQEKGFPVSDLSLLRLIMDSIEESSSATFSIKKSCVMCCFSLIKAIEQISLGQCIPSNTAEIILKMYPTLLDSDYKGPCTYQSTSRLPLNYRESIKKESELLKLIEQDQKKEDYNTDTSEDTEGPEEEDMIIENQKLDDATDCNILINTQSFKLHDTPKNLDNDAREGARRFFKALHKLLPLLVPMRSSIQVDQSLQNFASQYCEGLIYNETEAERSKIKADGIYIAIYFTLLLDMHLVKSEYYTSVKESITITEEDFLIKAKGVGILSYLSSAWLRELYQLIVSSSLLQMHGYLPFNSQPHALINLLTDIEGGLGLHQKQSQILWECRRLVKSSALYEDNVEKSAGLRLCRRILTCCWETLIKVLAIPLTEKRFRCRQNNLRDFKFLKKNERSKQLKHLVTASINGLQILTKLCNKIEMQDRCGNIIKLLASASCSNFKEKNNLMRFQMLKSDNTCLTPSHSLTLELLLGSGLEIGSNCPDCWSHVFRCCIYVKKLEHKYFSKSENRNLGLVTNVTKKNEVYNINKNSNLNFDLQFDEDHCVDVYSFLCSLELTQTVSQLVSTTNLESTEILKPSDTAKVICILSQLVDKLFEDAALKMNLKSLKNFSSVLCHCSRLQLFPSNSVNNESKRFWWFKLSKNINTEEVVLLLDFTGEIMLRSIRSGRPLFHIMQIWEIIVPHLMEAACHKDLTIARKAVQHIHDSINAALTEHPELQNFYTTEMWFKPFEKLLFLELCEPDIQDQIVSCICEFVEANYRDIRSGWRPLFAALGASLTNINTVLEVFRVFIEIDNIAIFSYAAVDYIMCLIKHLKLQSRCNEDSEFLFEILKYLKKCQGILNSTYKMPQNIKFHSACHIQVSDGILVDSVIKDFDLLMWKSTDSVPEDLKINLESPNSLNYFSQFECSPTLDSIDRPGGVLRVWFLLLEGMLSAVISANSALQPLLLKVLYEDLENLLEEPGSIFGLIILNRLVLPMTQSWLRQLSEIQEKDVLGFKQFIGLISDLVLKYFDRLQNDQTCENLLNLLLSQILLLLCECSIHQVPEVSKIGPPCIRHIIVNMRKIFSSTQWTIAIMTLHRLCDLSLRFLRQLMAPFSKDSEYYYGDMGQVKIAVRQADSLHQVLYSNQLFHSVFLLDEPYENFTSTINNDCQKVYTFLINKSNDETIRISLTSLISTLQAHHYIIQIIADVFIDDAIKEMSSLNFILNKNYGCRSRNQTEQENKSLHNLISSLTPSAISRLLSCLDYSYQSALAFDSRPGLKFLIQKVAGLQRAANLYHQIGVAWAVKCVTLFEYCISQIKHLSLSTEDVKHRLDASILDSNSGANAEEGLLSFSFFLNKLRISFNELCTSYLKVVMTNTKETLSKSRKFEKPLFYLMSAYEENLSRNEKDEIDMEDDKNSFECNQSQKAKTEKTFWPSDFSKQFHFTENNVENLSKSDKKEETKLAQSHHEILKHLFLTKNKNEECLEFEKINVKDIKELFVPPEIEQQRRDSFLKDSEAHRRVWTHMLGLVFELLQRLEDDDFQKVLPVFIDGVGRLMARVSEPVLKQHISEFFQRIANLYGFGIV